MLSVKRIKNKNYHIDLAREDYYQTGGEAPGKWHGLGAESLGLRGLVNRDELHRIMDGFNPDGTRKLVQNAGTEKTIYRNRQGVLQEKEREIGWDFTLSVPKTYAVEWSQGDSKKRTALEKLFEDSARKTLNWLEKQVTTRRGKGGVKRELVKLVMALFEHGTSRELDPQPHIHCLILNVGVREDGTTGAIQIDELLKHKMTAGALFRAELAKQLNEKLGYEIGAHLQGKDGLFDIQGVSPELAAEFSKRRKAIEERLEERGEQSAIAAAVAAVDTRQPKSEIPPREELFKIWQEIGREFGYEPPVPKFLHCDVEQMKREAACRAVNEVLEKQGSFSRNDLLRRVAELAPRYGLGIQEINDAVEERLAQNDLICLGQVSGEPHYSSNDLFLREKQGGIAVVETLEKVTAWQRQGYRVIGVARRGKAALRLQNQKGIKSYSLHRFLNKLRDGHIALDNQTLVVLPDTEIPRQLLSELMAQIERGRARLAIVGIGGELKPLGEVAQDVQLERQEEVTVRNHPTRLPERTAKAMPQER